MASGSLLLADVDVLGVDHLVRRAARRSAATRAAGTAGAGRPGSRRPALGLLLVHRLGQLVRGLGEPLRGLLHGRGVLALQGLPGLGQGLLDLALLRRPALLLVLVIGLLRVVDQAV